MKVLKLLPLLVLLIAIAGFGKQFFSKSNATSPRIRDFPQSKHGTVVKVADGDTLTIDLEGKETRIRLCGIDAPEKSQQFGQESKALLQKLTLGKEVAVMPIDTDRYGRTVAEVFTVGASEHYVNGDMVQAGLAYHYDRYSKDCINRDVIITAEGIAREQRAGVWANPGSVKPWDYRRAH